MKRFALLPLLLCLYVITAGNGACSSDSTPSAADKSVQANNNLQGQVHQSVNNVEFRNYNLRQKISDDPATILWCTFFPPGVQGVTNGSTPGQAITVPIAGKLTSSNKRPYDSTGYTDRGNYSWTPNEVPGPDHMFGASSEYRYGFDPTLSTYYDFANLASFCTTEATVWQVKATQVVVQTDPTLKGLTAAAESAIRSNHPQEALNVLKQAETVANSKRGK